MKRYSKKQCRKLFDGKCFFCGESEYKLLDCHRIYEGKNGGNYAWENTLTVCCKCHRKIHNKLIQILGSHPSSLGKRVIHYIDEDGQEKWKQVDKYEYGKI